MDINVNLWHTVDELKHFNGMCILIYTDNRRIVEAQYFGTDNGEPLFTVNGLEINNSQILLWCNRSDLLKNTNFKEKQKEARELRKR